jgi:hypothetical protein
MKKTTFFQISKQRFLLGIGGLMMFCLPLSQAVAQEVESRVTINQTYQRGTVRHDKAFENITAYNKVENTAKAQYEAGKSVVLLPGFTANTGSVFKANIALVTATRSTETVVMALSASPNPFVESTEIEYFLPVATNVTLNVSNITGQDMATLVNNEFQEKGTHKVKFTAYNLTQGGYQYTLKTDEGSLSKRLVKE